jgi:hypothetical protein
VRPFSLNAWASLGLTWWSLLGIIGMLYLGVYLAGYVFFENGLSAMNSMVVIQWIAKHSASHPIVLLWLILLVILAGVLAINLGACLYQRISNTWKNGRGLRFWIFLTVHLIFGLVMTLHGLEMVTGQKHPWQNMLEGQSFNTDSGWGLKVDEIIFADDVSILKSERGRRRTAMTSDKFDVKANHVRASLLKNGKVVKSGEIRIMKPLVYENTRVVLNRFDHGPQGVSASLRIVNTPLHKLFFTSYLLLISALFIWFVVRCLRFF